MLLLYFDRIAIQKYADNVVAIYLFFFLDHRKTGIECDVLPKEFSLIELSVAPERNIRN